MCRNKGGTSPNDSADMEALMAHVTFDIEKGTFVTTPETHVEQIQAFLRQVSRYGVGFCDIFVKKILSSVVLI